MMKHLLAAIALVCAAGGAHAQNAQVLTGGCGTANYAGKGSAPVTVDTSGNECVTTTAGAAVTGFGTLAATTSSALLSTATAGPTSAVWPTTPAQVWVNNSLGSAGAIYVCPLGGTCAATTGIPIYPGAAYGFLRPSTAMTVIAATTATVVGQW